MERLAVRLARERSALLYVLGYSKLRIFLRSHLIDMAVRS